MTTRRVTTLLLALALLSPAATLAQEAGKMDWLELLRSDLRTEKVAIMTEAMQLSEDGVRSTRMRNRFQPSNGVKSSWNQGIGRQGWIVGSITRSSLFPSST